MWKFIEVKTIYGSFFLLVSFMPLKIQALLPAAEDWGAGFYGIYLTVSSV